MAEEVIGRQYAAEEEIDLREYAAVIWRSRWLVAAVVAAAVVLAAVWSCVLPPVYRVESLFALPQMSGGLYANAATAREILTSPDFLGRAARRAGVASDPVSVQQLRLALRVEPVQNSSLVRIALETAEPSAGEALIKSLIELYAGESESEIAVLRNLLQQQLSTVKQRLAEVQTAIEQSRRFLAAPASDEPVEARFERAMVLTSVQGQEEVQLGLTDRYLSLQRELASLKGVQVVQPADTLPDPVRPRPALNMAVAGVLGLMVSVLWAFGKEYWRRSGSAEK